MLVMDELISLIKAGAPFKWVRYGDGEWFLVLGRRTETHSRSQVFSESLREAMRETVRDHHSKVMAIQNEPYLRKIKLYQPIQDWLQANKVRIDWRPGDILHRASASGRLAPFIRALNRPVFVGPAHFRNLPIQGDLLEIQPKDCWDRIDEIESEMRSFCAGRTVCISAGPAAKVLIHRLRHEDMQLIDCGSLWDVYCGKRSRRYQKAMTPEIIERNLRA
jgi:hypothetical protein